MNKQKTPLTGGVNQKGFRNTQVFEPYSNPARLSSELPFYSCGECRYFRKPMNHRPGCLVSGELVRRDATACRFFVEVCHA